MRRCIAELKSVAPLSWSRWYEKSAPKKTKEKPADYELRTWKERLHYTEQGNAFIPPMAFKKSVERAAQYLSLKIEGKGNATYSKFFKSGVLVVEGLDLAVTRDTVKGEWVFVPSNGRSGGGTRVEKCFPIVHQWAGRVEYLILNDTLTESVFIEHLEEAGNFIGIGRFRPENGGFYGRYQVASHQWVEIGGER